MAACSHSKPRGPATVSKEQLIGSTHILWGRNEPALNWEPGDLPSIEELEPSCAEREVLF